MQQAQSPTPGTLNEALALIAQQQADMARLHAAHASWMRAVAHDLRAPLRHVVSFAPLLKESVGELAAAAPQAVHAAEDAHEFASTMERAARKMSAMLDGLVHISRAARAELQPELLDWVALTVPLVQALQAQHPQVQWTLPTQAQVPVLAHAEWLRVVMQAVLDAGADIINDIWALRQAGAREIIAAHPRSGVCLMHMHQTPQTMHLEHMQADPVAQVRQFLAEQVAWLEQLGVARERITLDYGIGFGKSVEQNFALLARQQDLLDLDLPLLAGWSRKGSLGTVTGLPVHERMVPSVTAAVLAVERGARVVRVHDVADTVAALKIWNAMHAHDAA